MDDNTRWEQLRAADPARHSSPPDLEALLALTREKIARDDSANHNDNTPDTAHDKTPGASNVIPLSSRRRVTRVLPFLAGAAAFGLIMGGGGYVIGAQKPFTDNHYSTVGDPTASGTPDIQPAPPHSGTEQLTPEMWPVPSAREVYRAGDGLSTTTSTGVVSSVDTTDVVTPAMFDTLKQVFQVQGGTRTEWGSYVTGDGADLTLSLSGGAPAFFYFQDTAVLDADGTPDTDTAINVATGILNDLNIDPATLSMTTSTSTYFSENNERDVVVVEATLSDNATQDALSWSFVVNGDQVYSASGTLGDIVALGDYDLVSARDAVSRLGDSRFSVTATGIMPMIERHLSGPQTESGQLNLRDNQSHAESTGDASSPDAPVGTSAQSTPLDRDTPPEGVGALAPGAVLPWPVTVQTIVAAELTSAPLTLDDGSYVIAPVWTLTAESGREYSVIAVAERHLDLEDR